MQIEGLKINFLGDSITEGCGTSDLSQVFWKLLEQRDGAFVRGYGIGGTRIARQRQASPEEVWDRYFRSRVEEMDPDADLVVVFGGTNDYGHGDAPFGDFSDRTDDTFYGALHNLYSSLIKKFPDAQLLVMTPLHREQEYALVNDLGLRNVGCLEDYVDAIMEVAGYYAIPVLDLYRESGMQPENPLLKEKYNPDGLHPNDAGHERIYRLLKQKILTL